MIGFAPANNPQVAVAVVVPNQYIGSDGASVAGPIMNKMLQAALPPGSVRQPCHVMPAPPPLRCFDGLRAVARRGPPAAATTVQHRRVYTICVATQIVESPAGEEFRSAVGMLKLLGDETRLRVIWALLEGEHSVNELAEVVGAQPAAVSQHLAKLRLARLVRSRREGTRIFYVVDDAHVRRLVEEVLTHADHVTAHG